VLRELGPSFGARAAASDATDSFVKENYRELKANRIFSVGVPLELGGGGAPYQELCALVHQVGRCCGSTALALSMHTHLLAAMVWRYRQGQPVAELLQRVADEELVLVSTGATDWLQSSGNAVRVEGGYRVSGRKVFASGSPAGDLLMTSAPFEDPSDGPTVLHFPLPLKAPGVTVLDNWRVMGMRGSGSDDVLLEGAFVPEDAVTLRRPRGRWHLFFNLAMTVANPLIMSAYVGVAEAARDLALQNVQRKRDDPDVWYLVGEMENALATARITLQSMIDLCANYDFTPHVTTANAMLIRKTITTQAVLGAVEKALELVGGAGFFRSMGMERLVRDIHGAQFHPLQPKRQHRFTGRVALGLEPD
jgi:alkylation response protein AidB-like acyl-CoA dehydrogenase